MSDHERAKELVRSMQLGKQHALMIAARNGDPWAWLTRKDLDVVLDAESGLDATDPEIWDAYEAGFVLGRCSRDVCRLIAVVATLSENEKPEPEAVS